MNRFNDELVILVHGFGSTRLWMRLLANRLRRAGYATCNWGYCSLIGSLEFHASHLRNLLAEKARDWRTVHIVAHSMGAIIVRLALSAGQPPRLGRVVQIAPPNHGSPVARLFGPLVRPICPAVAELSSHAESRVNHIAPLDNVQIGVIAARFDLLVPQSSTLLEGQTDRILLTATHNSLLFQQSVMRNVHAFLSNGRFEHSAADR